MKAYSYNENGLFISEFECRLDPVRTKREKRDCYAVPANATTVAPPEFNAETQECYYDLDSMTWSIKDKPEPIPENTEEIERQNRIFELKNQLTDSDYKVIKCFEYQMAGLDAPYDVNALHEERQAIRDEINEMESS